MFSVCAYSLGADISLTGEYPTLAYRVRVRQDYDITPYVTVGLEHCTGWSVSRNGAALLYGPVLGELVFLDVNVSSFKIRTALGFEGQYALFPIVVYTKAEAGLLYNIDRKNSVGLVAGLFKSYDTELLSLSVCYDAKL